MTPDALYLAADVAWFIGRLGALLILGGILTIVATVLVHAVTDGRRVLADAPWPPCEDGCHRPDCDHGQALAESFWDTCAECGQDRCICDLRQEWAR